MYAWIENGTKVVEPCGAWPATALTLQNSEGFYYYQFDEDIKAVNFIFNVGSDQAKTSNLWTDEDVCYTWANGAEKQLESCEVPESIVTIEEDEIPALDLSQPMYNVLGQVVGDDYQGVVIQNAHKYLR